MAVSPFILKFKSSYHEDISQLEPKPRHVVSVGGKADIRLFHNCIKKWCHFHKFLDVFHHPSIHPKVELR